MRVTKSGRYPNAKAFDGDSRAQGSVEVAPMIEAAPDEYRNKKKKFPFVFGINEREKQKIFYGGRDKLSAVNFRKTKGSFNMGTEYANKHIGCTIKNCAHHCCCEDFCSLDKIEVGTHEANPTVVQCTDCLSFKAKPGVG